MATRDVTQEAPESIANRVMGLVSVISASHSPKRKKEIEKVSKYLKWYDSYVDHTPTDDLAKNELESAHRKIKHLTESLAKANERVKELDQENKEFAMLIANLVRRADVKTDLLQNPTFEKASEQLNKFAIEKKCEGINDFMHHFRYEYEGARDTDSIESFADDFVEQLRKEQE